MLGLLYTIGLDILGQHTIGHVNGKDNIYPFSLDCLELGTYLRIDQGYDDKETYKAEKDELHPGLEIGSLWG